MQPAPIGMALVATNGNWLESIPRSLRHRRLQPGGTAGPEFPIDHPSPTTGAPTSKAIGRLVSRELPTYRREKNAYVQRTGTVWVNVHRLRHFPARRKRRHLVSQSSMQRSASAPSRPLREYQGAHLQAMDARSWATGNSNLAAGAFSPSTKISTSWSHLA